MLLRSYRGFCFNWPLFRLCYRLYYGSITALLKLYIPPDPSMKSETHSQAASGRLIKKKKRAGDGGGERTERLFSGISWPPPHNVSFLVMHDIAIANIGMCGEI